MNPSLFAALLFLCAAIAVRSEIVINEIHFKPAIDTDLTKFIELYNTATDTSDLGGWRLSGGIDFTFPSGTVIAPGGYVVVSENPAALKAKFGATALGPWTGNLSGRGEKITLRNTADLVIDEVDFQNGFPWPTVGYEPESSIELVNPGFDNDLGGNWRASLTASSGNPEQSIVPIDQNWRFNQSGSDLGTAWRAASFDDSAWSSGKALLFHEDAGLPAPKNTALNLGRTTYYFRTHFNFAGDPAQAMLLLRLVIDDGAAVYLNGQELYRLALAPGAGYSAFATRTVGDAAYEGPFTPSSAALRTGDNVLAVEVHQANASSSDIVFGLSLSARAAGVAPGTGPTPGAQNSVFATNLPPIIRQVDHSPEQPFSGVPVRISAKITDADGIKSVVLQYQLVDPGKYIELSDPEYSTQWTSVPMNDAGTDGDKTAGDNVYSTTLPASLQTNRRLVRYRITAADMGDRAVTVPYPDDPQPNFAYFVYDGVPAYSAAIQPGSTDPARRQVVEYPAEVMRTIPAYHLISKSNSIAHCQFIDHYGGQEYLWSGTMVYDGKVYDHIHYRARGGVWRYAMGKNAWKIKFNAGHHFEARDNYGNKYSAPWARLNFRPGIQQADYQHRGEQGMFEAVNYRLFNLAGVEACNTQFFQLRVVDDASESGATQYDGDFWGLYLGVEEADGAFIDDHDLPDGNLYMMRNSSGTIQNQGRTAAPDGSDLASFLNTFRGTTPSESWWRTNLDLNSYYTYRTLIECIHHYDIDDPPGKNYFFYLNPVTGQWSVHPWDMDLTWGNNMYGGGNEPFRDRVLPRTEFSVEYKNRGRELRDLLFNPEQIGQLIDETASFIYKPQLGPTIAGADRAQWDYNPIMVSPYVNSGKAGQGLFYKFPLESVSRDFTGALQLMKNYVVSRGQYFDQNFAADPAIPGTPQVTSAAPSLFPANRLRFHSSSYSGSAAFAGMKWRIAEVTSSNAPAFDPAAPRLYEITTLWDSGELNSFTPDIAIPPGVAKVGHAYRVRARLKDASGRWSHWSAPLEFIAGEPDSAADLVLSLRVTEIMYNPPAGSDYEFIELHNVSADTTLDLAGVKFTQGIDYIFPPGAALLPGAYALVTRADGANNFAAFRAHYKLDGAVAIYGPYSGALNNDGERVTLKTASAGSEIASFNYSDRAGWPAAPGGTAHSLVLQAGDRALSGVVYDYPGAWRASAFIGGSPGSADPLPAASLVINEIAANTIYNNSALPGYDSNDWIELYNSGPAVAFGDYYLSDDTDNLKKWRIPSGSLAPGGRISFDEISGFHNPLTNGFGLNKAGEALYLSYLPGNAEDRVVDAIRFKAQDTDASFGRYPDGGSYWYTLQPTRDGANQLAATGLKISEIMYHPKETNGLENSWAEYIEIYNAGSSRAVFTNAAGSYRLDGGISFRFPANLSLDPGAALAVVSFDPSDSAALNRFNGYYSLQSPLQLAGPYSGQLGNSSDRVAIEKPQAPDLPGGSLSWIVIDEVIYSEESGADGTAESLARLDFNRSGADPANLSAGAPSPGSSSSVAPAELRLTMSGTTPVKLTFTASGSASYTVEFRDDLGIGDWQRLQDLSGVNGSAEVTDPAPLRTHRFYRVVQNAAVP